MTTDSCTTCGSPIVNPAVTGIFCDACHGGAIDDTIKQQQRSKKMKTLAIFVGAPICIALWALPFGGAVADDLEQDGYSDVRVERSGVFSFKFEANKGAAKCSGTVTKMPGSQTSSNFCTTGTGDVDLSSN